MYKVIVLIVTVLCLSLSGQEGQQTAPQVTATTVVGPTEFKTGDTVKLIVRLAPTPRGYGGGRVTAIISRIPPQPSLPDVLNEAKDEVPLLDGVSEYEFRFKVMALFQSGDWSLARVQFGRATTQVVRLPDRTATFKINTEEPPIKVTSFSGPKSMANGTVAVFRIVIDKDFRPLTASEVPLDYGQCPDTLSILFYPENPPGQGEKTPIKLEPGKLSYEVTFERLPDAQPTGKWRGILVSRKVPPSDGECRSRGLSGETEVRFEVTPSTVLVVPTAVQEVILNPSEVQLLRVQASALQHEAEMLQKALFQGTGVNEQKLLKDAVAAALDNLSDTEQSYKKQAQKPDPASPVFFDDLRRIYHDLLVRLAFTQRNARLEYASARFTVDDAGTAVVESILHNVKAYITVADTQRWTFTLKLRTDPQGARISYCRKPDPFVPFDALTNSDIENLPIAIWFVRFEKDGYELAEVRYDAAIETSPVYSKLRRLPKRKASR